VAKEEIAKGKLIVLTKDVQHKEIAIDALEDEGYGRRENCQRCEFNITRMADIAYGNWGV
jgi:formate dehydrogenase subunit beta